jgi:hypothetical protein
LRNFYRFIFSILLTIPALFLASTAFAAVTVTPSHVTTGVATNLTVHSDGTVGGGSAVNLALCSVNSPSGTCAPLITTLNSSSSNSFGCAFTLNSPSDGTFDSCSSTPGVGDYVVNVTLTQGTYVALFAGGIWDYSALVTIDPAPTPTTDPIPHANPSVVASTSDLISGVKGAAVTNLGVLIPIGAILLISIAVVYWVIRHFRGVARE